MIGFKQKLINQYHFSESDWEKSRSHFTPETLEPKVHFLKQGEVADRLGFVKKGLLRSYYFDDNGRDITLQFFQPENIVISNDSFNNLIPSNENICTYERTELMIVTHHHMLELYQEIPAWQQICKDISEMKNKLLIERTIQFQTLTAAERYHSFCQQFPELICKVPLGHVASYLGIDIATLSRLRKKK